MSWVNPHAIIAGYLLYTTKKYGWYSEQAARQYGVHIYLTPHGEEVAVSFVERGIPNTGWEDLRLVGEVTTWVRNVGRRNQ